MTTALDNLGRVGVWTTAVANCPAPELRESLAEYEALGFRTIWYGEAFARESFASAALVLSWTEKLIAATGITNVYARDAGSAKAGSRTIAEAFPGRFVFGLGISHPHPVSMRGHAYGPPLTTMRNYLDAMDAVPYTGPEPAEPVPTVLAALGPKMLDLARDRTDGAHPYFVPPEHTA
ncbi:MAG TPA: LLM class flavin-dependent oxidoreductase, partial [Gaiellaceae bacterium]|nr:LLM class flavin-dependent oxidoreductase [Gaiellaceae bacterium]